MEINYKVTKNFTSINELLQNDLKISSRLLFKLIKYKKISINNNVIDTRIKPNIGDIITINFNYEEDNLNIVPTKIDLDIIYEDKWLLIVNKPAGIAIHPSILHYSDSLCNGIRFYFDKIGLKKKIRPVNRLDLNTSGLVIFAKCEYIQECLILQMNKQSFKKEYLALCEGIFENHLGTIDSPIARKENSIIERCISPSGQIAITHYEVLKEFHNYSLVKCIIDTGRTHQIRVHMASISHSLLGDTLYGKSSNLINRQALHCYKLCFIHPISNKELEFICQIPDDFKSITTL